MEERESVVGLTPASEATHRRRKRGARFATVLWGTVGFLLLALATNDVLRDVQGAGVGWLAIVSLAAGTMLIHAAVRIGRSELRR